MSVINVISTEQWEKLLADTSTPILVDFFATWCGPCVRIAPVIAEMATKYEKVTFVKIDVDKVKELAQHFEISAMPTFKFFNKGEEVKEIVGADPRAILETVEALSKAE